MKNIHLGNTTIDEGLTLYQDRFKKSDKKIQNIKGFLDCLGMSDMNMLDLNNQNFADLNTQKIAEYINDNGLEEKLCPVE